MNKKKLFQLLVVTAFLFTSFAITGSAQAITQCSGSVIVQWGDTLSGIAAYCGTTMDAIRAANPGLGWWLYAGQVLNMPSGSSTSQPPIAGGTYVVQAGDTLKIIAARAGITIESILAANPQVVNMNLIYIGQVLTLPKNAPPVITPIPTKVTPPTTQPPFQPAALAWGPLKVKYKYGLYIRDEPNGKIVASALAGDTLYYRPGSDISDGKGWIWVEVKLYPPTQGLYSGWVLVRDQYGIFFTKPRFRPFPKVE
jgi:LysM repeat protein